MNLAFKKFVFIVSLLLFVHLFAIFSINYYFDFYGVFKSRTKFSQEPNQNFMKIDYILKNKEKYDSFIFGSSRVGLFDPAKFDNGKYYNMTYSEGLPFEHLQVIKLLLSSGVQIKNIIIGLDEFSYMIDPKKHFFEPSRKMHFLLTDKSKFQFYFYYLTLYPNKEKIKRALSSKKYNTYFQYDIFNSGMPIVPKIVDDAIENNPKSHVKKQIFNTSVTYEGLRIKKTINELQQIVNLSKKYHINLTIFIHPIHQTTYLHLNHEYFFQFLQELSLITNYYDFSGINAITTDNMNYYENVHYRQHIAELIIDEISSKSHLYATLVTRDNINNHLKSKMSDIALHLNK